MREGRGDTANRTTASDRSEASGGAIVSTTTRARRAVRLELWGLDPQEDLLIDHAPAHVSPSELLNETFGSLERREFAAAASYSQSTTSRLATRLTQLASCKGVPLWELAIRECATYFLRSPGTVARSIAAHNFSLQFPIS